MIIAYQSGEKACEANLFDWLGKCAHGAVWSLGVWLTREEREDIVSEMLESAIMMMRDKDLNQVNSPGGWLIRTMRNTMLDTVDKSVYRTKMKRALNDYLKQHPELLSMPMRRQCMEKDRFRGRDVA